MKDWLEGVLEEVRRGVEVRRESRQMEAWGPEWVEEGWDSEWVDGGEGREKSNEDAKEEERKGRKEKKKVSFKLAEF